MHILYTVFCSKNILASGFLFHFLLKFLSPSSKDQHLLWLPSTSSNIPVTKQLFTVQEENVISLTDTLHRMTTSSMHRHTTQTTTRVQRLKGSQLLQKSSLSGSRLYVFTAVSKTPNKSVTICQGSDECCTSRSWKDGRFCLPWPDVSGLVQLVCKMRF